MYDTERIDKDLKRYIVFFSLIIASLFLLCSCNLLEAFKGETEEGVGNQQQTGDETAQEEVPDEAAFAEILGNTTQSYVVGIFPDDYNLDGIYEAYALTSENELQQEDVHSSGISLWFIGSGKATLLLESGDYSATPALWKFSDKTLFSIDEYTEGVPNSKVFFVSGSGAYSYGDFGAKLVRAGDDSCDFYAWVSAQDSVYKAADSDFPEGNEKPYYLYFDGNFFCEYGGILVREDQLRAVEGADRILTAISGGGYTIGDIYYRENGIININLSKTLDNKSVSGESVTLTLSGEGVYLIPRGESFSVLGNTENTELSHMITEGTFEDLQAFSYAGHYGAAVLPELATFPLEFKQ